MKDNKLITEFMGVNAEIISTGNVHSWSDSPFFYTTEDSKEKVMENIAWYAKYHTSWDWLIPVVAKCTELNDDEFDNQSIAWALLSDSIIDAYDHVVEFIKTYNKE